jgi:Zn-finger nucleic acid-binding protein
MEEKGVSTRGVKVERGQLDKVMVRRLKPSLRPFRSFTAPC